MLSRIKEPVVRRRAAAGRRRRGFTMLEIMIASAIMVTVLAITSAGYLAMLRIERSNTVVADFASQSLHLKRLLRKYASAALQIVSPDGRSVLITERDGNIALIAYEDDDGDWTTIGDNRIVFIENFNPSNPTEFEGTLVINYVTAPNNGADPIFTRAGGYSPLQVNFVIGDYTPDPSASCHAFTGRGYQSYSFQAQITPRNVP